MGGKVWQSGGGGGGQVSEMGVARWKDVTTEGASVATGLPVVL